MTADSSQLGEPGSCMVGIDIGSTSTKVALIAVAGGVVRELAMRSATTPSDPRSLVAEIFRMLAELTAEAPRSLAAIGIASMAESGVPLDRSGAPLTGILRWDRTRDNTAADALVASLGAEALFDATGVPAGPKAPLCTWQWLRTSHAEVFRAMALWAGVADLVAFALTDRLATDHTLAGRTMGYRLPAVHASLPGEFDAELLAAAGIRPEQLPAVVRPDEAIGGVTAAASSATGIQSGVPVFIAGHDHSVGAWAAGMREAGDSADSIGTTEAVVMMPSHAPNRSRLASSGMSIVRTVTGEAEAILGGSPAAGSLVHWWREHELGQTDFTAMLRSLAGAPPEPARAIVLPYPRGRQCPSPDAEAALRVIAADGSSPVTRTRALFEGLAFHARWIYETQRVLSREHSRGRPVHLLGAAVAANTFWAAVKATTMPVPLRLAAVREPVAAGAALLAGVRSGLLSYAPVLPMREIQPLPIDLDASYAAFLAAATAVPQYQGEQ